ncbi:hypothetical protein QQ045_017825 [Rhodiola kirilowii]
MFGFVRYRTMAEAKAAIRRWNGTMVGNRRLVVKLADNKGKPNDFKQNFERLINSFQGNTMAPEHGLKECKQKDKEKEQSCHESIVTRGGKKEQIKRRKLKLEAIPEQQEWFKFCATTELRLIILVDQLEEEMRKDGIRFIKVIPAWGMMIIQFATIEELEKF